MTPLTIAFIFFSACWLGSIALWFADLRPRLMPVDLPPLVQDPALLAGGFAMLAIATAPSETALLAFITAPLEIMGSGASASAAALGFDLAVGGPIPDWSARVMVGVTGVLALAGSTLGPPDVPEAGDV